MYVLNIAQLWLVASFCSADKILLVSHQMVSHLSQLHMVGEGLASKGHQVYSILHATINTDKLPMRGIQPIYQHTSQEDIERAKKLDKLITKVVFAKDSNVLQRLEAPVAEANYGCNVMLHDAELLATLRKHQFDLAVVDLLFLAPCTFLLPHELGIPYVSVAASAAAGMFVGGTPSLPSFVPLSLFSHSDKMDFFERLYNFAFAHFSSSPFFIGNSNTALLKEFAPDVNSWYALIEKSLLHCLSGDHVLNWPAPTMPNVIRTPGITIQPAKPLPEHFQTIVSNSDFPVIIMTFGSAFANLPLNITTKFVAAFSQVNYTIIWRLDAESSSQVTMPDNVHVVSWLPQNDLLGHPATKLFITHCGNNGQYEAVYQGVPMIGFPLFAEQPYNCFRMEHHQLGRCLDIRTFDSDLLAKYIKEVASDGSTYQTTVQKRSAILQDSARPVDTMVRWIEHVMTHGGEHLRSHAVDMPWYQYWMLDVLSLIIIVIFVMLAAIIWAAKKLCCSKQEKYKQL